MPKTFHVLLHIGLDVAYQNYSNYILIIIGTWSIRCHILRLFLNPRPGHSPGCTPYYYPPKASTRCHRYWGEPDAAASGCRKTLWTPWSDRRWFFPTPYRAPCCSETLWTERHRQWVRQWKVQLVRVEWKKDDSAAENFLRDRPIRTIEVVHFKTSRWDGARQRGQSHRWAEVNWGEVNLYSKRKHSKGELWDRNKTVAGIIR